MSCAHVFNSISRRKHGKANKRCNWLDGPWHNPLAPQWIWRISHGHGSLDTHRFGGATNGHKWMKCFRNWRTRLRWGERPPYFVFLWQALYKYTSNPVWEQTGIFDFAALEPWLRCHKKDLAKDSVCNFWSKAPFLKFPDEVKDPPQASPTLSLDLQRIRWNRKKNQKFSLQKSCANKENSSAVGHGKLHDFKCWTIVHALKPTPSQLSRRLLKNEVLFKTQLSTCANHLFLRSI